MKLLKPVLGTVLLAGLLSVNTAYAGEVLDKIMSTKTVKIATDANWPPQSFINDNNEMDGFDVDVAREIAKRLGAEVEFITPAWDVITAGNWHGRWDMHVGSMTPTKKRAEVLVFPSVYYYTPAAMAVHKDAKYTKVSEMHGKKIGVTTSSTYEFYLDKSLEIDAEGAPPFAFKVDNAVIRSYESSTVSLDDLRLGDGVRLDGVITSVPAILEAIENGYPIKQLAKPLFYEPVSVTIDLGDRELSDKLKSLVVAMREDGTLTKLSMKWYGVDYAIAAK